jgi:hypothetical protein
MHTRIKHPSNITYSHTLCTNTRRVYGHQPYCACGWQGRVHDSVSDARAEASLHMYTAHEVRP